MSVLNNIIKNPSYNGLVVNILKVTGALGLKPYEIYLHDKEWEEGDVSWQLIE